MNLLASIENQKTNEIERFMHADLKVKLPMVHYRLSKPQVKISIYKIESILQFRLLNLINKLEDTDALKMLFNKAKLINYVIYFYSQNYLTLDDDFAFNDMNNIPSDKFTFLKVYATTMKYKLDKFTEMENNLSKYKAKLNLEGTVFFKEIIKFMVIDFCNKLEADKVSDELLLKCLNEYQK